MNWERIIDELLAAARSEPANGRVPYAFERRILARLAGAPPADAWALWGRALWRSAALCLAVMTASGLWWIWPAPHLSRPLDFSQEFQHAVFAQASQVDVVE
ncbi:MAG: hypothetical protein JXQ71_06860 [Verrucomicrobia bacterium]|nr:hypothetical protein [Verrucomicrobiota bacterium]